MIVVLRGATDLTVGIEYHHVGKDGSVNQKNFKMRADQIKPLVPSMGGALATDRIMVDGMPIGYMYREAPELPEDSGWRFFAGDEDQAYVDDSKHTSLYAVNTIANYDPDIIPYIDTPAPCAFEKIEGSRRYQPVENPGDEDA
jgi:hypothetical protein